MIAHNVVQRSPEWIRARLGIPTASDFHKIVTPKRCELSKQAPDYMARKLAEWMLDAPLPEVITEYMQRGAELEDEAVRAYEFETGLKTEKVGFLTTDDGMIGCSPDRLVESAGCLEIECPAAHTHVGYMLSRDLGEDYAPQAQGQLFITGRAWVDTVSYYPGLPTVVIRTPRRDMYIAYLSKAIESFVETMLRAREDLSQRYGPFARQHAKPKEDFGGLGITDADVEAIMRQVKEGALMDPDVILGLVGGIGALLALAWWWWHARRDQR